MWKRIDLSIYATALIALCSFVPWADIKWVSTGCSNGGANGGVLSIIAVLGWLTGATLLVVSLVRARHERKLWRDLMLLPAVGFSILGLGFLISVSWSADCGGGFMG